MSNTNKELYEWAWNEYHKGREIDILLKDMRYYLRSWELVKSGDVHSPTTYGFSDSLSINKAYVPLLIEALENLR